MVTGCKVTDSLKYSVEIAQFQDLIYKKQKFYFVQRSGIFLLATWPTCSITWPGHVTKQGKNTQRSATIFNCSLPLTCLITRGETLLLLTLNFSPLLTIPIPLFPWNRRTYFETISNYAFAKFQPHLIESIQRHYQIMFKQFQIVSPTKFFLLCLPIPYSCQSSLNSVH